MELSLKLAVPLTIALGSWHFSNVSSSQQNKITRDNQKDSVIREYIKEIKGMLLDKSVADDARKPGTAANGVARALTLTALTQLKGQNAERQSLIFQFLRDSDFPVLSGSASIQGANLSRYDLRKTWLTRANLSWSNLSGANLSGTDLRGAALIGADLHEADLSGADLSGADLSGANLIKAKLSGTKLIGADLSGSYLSGANLIKANLSGANLSGTNLIKARFKETTCPDGNKTEKGCMVP